MRFTERCRELEGEPGQRRAERVTALYSRDPGGLFEEARERSDEVNYGEMSYFRRDEHGAHWSVSLGAKWRLNCPAFASRRSMIGYLPSEGKITLRVVQGMSYISQCPRSQCTHQTRGCRPRRLMRTTMVVMTPRWDLCLVPLLIRGRSFESLLRPRDIVRVCLM